MLVIKKEQIHQFIASGESRLAEVIAKSVRVANGERVAKYSDNELQSMVKIGIERSRSRGLVFAEDIAAYVAIMFEVAPRFDEQPEINTVLVDETLPFSLRLELLFAPAMEPAWSDAEKKYEDSFWFAK
jgi:hypothetical protein